MGYLHLMSLPKNRVDVSIEPPRMPDIRLYTVYEKGRKYLERKNPQLFYKEKYKLLRRLILFHVGGGCPVPPPAAVSTKISTKPCK